MTSPKFISLTIIFLLFNFKLEAQIHQINKDSIIAGYSLLYGNTSIQIIDFEVMDDNMVVIQTKPGIATFILFNKENLPADTLHIKCWPQIDFWRIGNKFFYHPMILYQNDFCKEDGRKQNKGQIATFEVINDRFSSVNCISATKKENDNEFVYFSPTSKVRELNTFKKGKFISSTIFINDTIKLYKEKFPEDRELYSIKRTKSGLIILDIKNNILYQAEERVKILHNILPKELNSSQVLSLDFDLISGKIYLIGSNLEDNIRTEDISLYGFNGYRFERIDQPNIKKGLKTKIRGNRIYTLFTVEEDFSHYFGIFQQNIIAWE